VVPQSEILKAPILRIEVTEGQELFTMNKDCFLEINACGLVGGKRGKSDGCVIIGNAGSPSF